MTKEQEGPFHGAIRRVIGRIAFGKSGFLTGGRRPFGMT